MKESVTILLIGSASSYNSIGQIANMENLINSNVSIICIDPAHKSESDDILITHSGMQISRNAIVKNKLCIMEETSEIFFLKYKFNPNTFYLILAFTGLELEFPSFYLAKRLGAKNNFWKNTKNALFLSMGCLCLPVNLLNFLLHLNLDPYSAFDSIFLNNRLHRLFYLQNAFFAIQNNIDAISRAFTNDIIPEWIEKSMLKLKKIGLNNMEEVHQKYLEIQNIINIREEIKKELQELGILQFWNQRPNNFTKQTYENHN